MRRREFLAFAATALPSFSARAQQKTPPVIGYIGAGSVVSAGHHARAFEQGLREFGYSVGQNIAIEYRWADGALNKLPDLVGELIGRRVEVIVSSATPAIWAAKRQTASVPIVMAGVTDPVGSGLVASLARPGGNITGLTHQSPETAGKRVDILREIVPALGQLAVLWNPDQPGQTAGFADVETAAKALRISLISVEVRNREDVEAALNALPDKSPDAFLELADPLTFLYRGMITASLGRQKLPAIHSFREWPDGGALMSYGAQFADLFRRAAAFVEKILRGAKPADLPIEQPTKFELVVNLKTARALGLTVPISLLARADEVIE